MTQLNLRNYQEEALSNVTRSFTDKIHKQLLVLPTGSGKTCIIIAIAELYGKKTLILAHRDELITQAYQKFKKFSPEADVGIYKGKNKRIDHQIIISSIQTCNKQNRLQQLKKKGFDVLIIDEAHHAPSE
jgi:ATP-dependent helicase IRC3